MARCPCRSASVTVGPAAPRLAGVWPRLGAVRQRRLGLALAGWLALAVLAGAPGLARGQGAGEAGLLVWRNQFDGFPERPERTLSAGAAVTVRAGRWRVPGATRLRVVSPDPQVAAVLRFDPLPGGGAQALRLYVTVVVRPSVPSFELESHGQLMVKGALAPQPHYPLGKQGIATALAGAPGRVAQVVIQDHADAEIRLRRDGEILVLQVVPPEEGGVPSGLGPPHGRRRPLRFSDADLLAAASTHAALGALIFGNRLALRVNARFPSGASTAVLRVLAMAPAWRGDRWALWVEGGAGSLNRSDASGGLHLAGGLALHWRYTNWGAALNVGRVGGDTVLELLGGWQLWRPVGLVAGWQRLPGGANVVLGAGFAF